MKSGDIGPLQAALRAHLDKVREACEGTDACVKPTFREIAEAIGFPPHNVQRAIERLRVRRAQIAVFVKDGRENNRIQPRRPPLTIVELARRARTPLERAWRGSDMGELS